MFFGVKALFTYRRIKNAGTPQAEAQAHSVPVPADLRTMEDFIERTLRERRSLQDALTDMLAKSTRIPFGIERSTLERMIEVLKDEIALRQNTLRIAK